MSFTCPIHGYYTPTPGTTVAICPSCQAAPAQPPVEQEGTARIAERFQKATDHAVHQSLPTVNIGWKLATEIARVLDPAPEQGEAEDDWTEEAAEFYARADEKRRDLTDATDIGAPEQGEDEPTLCYVHGGNGPKRPECEKCHPAPSQGERNDLAARNRPGEE